MNNSSTINKSLTQTRICAGCGNELFYKSIVYFQRANRKNSLCNSCSLKGRVSPNKGKTFTTEHKHKLSEARQKRIITDVTRKKTSDSTKGVNNPNYGNHIPCSEETKNKLRISLLNLPADVKDRIVKENKLRNKNLSVEARKKISDAHKGKKLTVEQIRKCRISAIKRIERNLTSGVQLTPNFNVKACQYFDSLNLQKNWNLQHAMNGGEFHLKNLGYWVDAYDKDKNVVVEYDESYHNSLKKKIKDSTRMNEIKNHLNCVFMRYNEATGELREYC